MRNVPFAARCAAAFALALAIAETTSAQAANEPQDVATLLRLTQEIDDLNLRIKGRLSEMISVAGLSPHGWMDPNVRLMSAEVAKHNRLLVQRTAQLEQRYAAIRGAEVQEAMQANAAKATQATGAQISQPETGKWRQIELDGQKYYLVPVTEIDGPPEKASRRRVKVITPTAPPRRDTNSPPSS